MRTLLPLLLLLTAVPLGAADKAADSPVTPVAVVVHADAAAGLTRERLVDLLTGRVAALPNGGRAVLVLSHGTGGEAAVLALTSRDVARLVRGWKRLVFGSGGSLPLTAADDRAAIELVGRTPDGLLPLQGVEVKDLPTDLRVIMVP